MEYEWLSSAGGPLIILPRRLMRHWHGVGIDENEPSDYGRACEIEEYIGLLQVGSGSALILAGDHLAAHWCATGVCAGGVLIRWSYAESEEDVFRYCERVPEEVWSDTGIRFLVDDELIMYDSANPSDELDEHQVISLSHGLKRVDTAEYQPDEDTKLILHRFLALSE